MIWMTLLMGTVERDFKLEAADAGLDISTFFRGWKFSDNISIEILEILVFEL